MGRPIMAAGKRRVATVALAHVLAVTLAGGRVVPELAAGVVPLAPLTEAARHCCCGTPDGRCCGMGCCRAHVPQSNASTAVADLRPVGDWWCAPRSGSPSRGLHPLMQQRWDAVHRHGVPAPGTLQRMGVRLNI
jgi:hypothetical protein